MVGMQKFASPLRLMFIKTLQFDPKLYSPVKMHKARDATGTNQNLLLFAVMFVFRKCFSYMPAAMCFDICPCSLYVQPSSLCSWVI